MAQAPRKPRGGGSSGTRPALKLVGAEVHAAGAVSSSRRVPRMKLTWEGIASLARSIGVADRQRLMDADTGRDRNPYRIAGFENFVPGVLPNDNKGMAADSAIDATYGQLGNVWADTGVQAWLGYPYLAELAVRPEYRRMSEAYAREATRKWIKIAARGDVDKSVQVAAIEKLFDKMRIRDVFKRACELDGYFGRSQLYIDVGTLQVPGEQETRLWRDPAKIPQGSFRGLTVIEPMWSYPSRYNSTNPLAADFYIPQQWFVMGQTVHTSRMLTFISRPVSNILAPAYAFGGLSLSQMAKPYVDNWLRTRQSVSDITHSFNVPVLHTDLAAHLGEPQDGTGELDKRIELWNLLRDNRDTLVIDKEDEEFTQVSAPLGSLDKLQAQALEQLSAVSGIPLVILLGITPSGLNASTEGEIVAWNTTIKAYQESFIGPQLDILMEVAQLSLFGVIDPDIIYQFNPLREMDDQQKAAIRKTNADTATVYIDAGILDPQEERERIATDEDSLWTNIDPDVMPIPPAPDPADGMGGEGGEGGPDDGGGAAGPSDSGGVKMPSTSAAAPASDPLDKPATDMLYAHDALIESDILYKPPVDRQGRARVPGQAFDGFYAVDAPWDESKIERDDDGKFSSTGGGGGGAAAPAGETADIPPPPAWLKGSACKVMFGKVEKAVKGNEAPDKVASDLIDFAGNYSHTGVAGYANALISHIEKTADLKKGTLGKAAAKGKQSTPPKETAATETPAPKPPPKEFDGPIAEADHIIAHTDLDVSEKTTALTAIVEDHPDTKAAKQAQAWMDANPVPAAPAAPDLPKPHPNSTGQNAVYNAATAAGDSAADKIKAIEAAVHASPSDFPSGGYALNYANTLAEALGHDKPISNTPTPAAKPKPAAAPKPPANKVLHAPQHLTRIKKAVAALDGAKQFSGASGAAQIAACPSLGNAFWDTANSSHVSAAKSYTGSGYSEINSALRSNVEGVSESGLKKAHKIDELFEQDGAAAAEDFIVRRGESTPDVEVEKWKKQLAAGVPLSYTKEGFISTSMASKAAFGSNPVNFEICVRKGTPALGVYTISGHKGENEIMLRHGQPFEIISIEEQPGGRHLVRMVTA